MEEKIFLYVYMLVFYYCLGFRPYQQELLLALHSEVVGELYQTWVSYIQDKHPIFCTISVPSVCLYVEEEYRR